MVVAEGLVDFKFAIEVGRKFLCAIIRTLLETQIAILKQIISLPYFHTFFIIHYA
jgi:hypothetical protein